MLQDPRENNFKDQGLESTGNGEASPILSDGIIPEAEYSQSTINEFESGEMTPATNNIVSDIQDDKSAVSEMREKAQDYTEKWKRSFMSSGDLAIKIITWGKLGKRGVPPVSPAKLEEVINDYIESATAAGELGVVAVKAAGEIVGNIVKSVRDKR
jgi:hypothetical protein